MSTDRVRRVQELRRSNAATARPGKRYAGPDPAEWNEEPVNVKIMSLDADGNPAPMFEDDGLGEIPGSHVQNVVIVLQAASSMMLDLAKATADNGEGNLILAGIVSGLGMTVDSVIDALSQLQNIVAPE